MPSTPTAKPTGVSQTSTRSGATEYRFMGNHATEVQMGDALPWLEPGEIVTLDDTDITEKIAVLVNDGILVDTSTIGVEPDQQAQAQSQSQDDDEEKGGK